MRIAVIADVHGNLIALEAVLGSIRALAPDLVVNLGDLVSGPFDPAGSADAQMALGCPTIAGNHERQLLEGGTGASDAFARPLLSNTHLDWIADGQIFACHGSPSGGDNEYLLDEVSDGRLILASNEAIRARLAGIGDARVVLCGHSHTPRIVSVDGVLIVNPGSVGQPGYRDVEPPHVVEAGTPHARFAIIEKQAAGWAAELRAVPYDYEAAALQAEQAGRPAVAQVVRTGRMPPA